MNKPSDNRPTLRRGMWMMLPSTDLAETASAEGFDFVALDMQHGYIENADVVAMTRAVRNAGAAQVAVRVQEARFTDLGKAADAGVDTLVVPLVSSAEQAAECVRAIHYPPSGVRSFGPSAEVIAGTPDPTDRNMRPELLLMVENIAGLEALEGICATEGVDGIFVGPSDLAFAVGELPGAASERLEETIEHIRHITASHSLVSGIHCLSGSDAARRIDQGFTYVIASVDAISARNAFRADLEASRAAG